MSIRNNDLLLVFSRRNVAPERHILYQQEPSCPNVEVALFKVNDQIADEYLSLGFSRGPFLFSDIE